MDKTTLEQAVQELIPKDLDDIIRKHRKCASLRLATDEDKAALADVIPPSARSVPISRWTLFTLAVVDSRGPFHTVHLVGFNDKKGLMCSTSPIVKLDTAAGLAVTRSGTLYAIRGEPGTLGFYELIQICVYLHRTPVGEFLGVPHFFY